MEILKAFARSMFLIVCVVITALGLSDDVHAACDYSNAVNGWGWDAETLRSCEPIKTQQPLAKLLTGRKWQCVTQYESDGLWTLNGLHKSLPEKVRLYFTDSGVVYRSQIVGRTLVSSNYLDWDIAGFSLAIGGRSFYEVGLQQVDKRSHLHLYTDESTRLSCHDG